MPDKTNFSSYSAKTLMISLAATAIAFATNMIIARCMGPHNRGALALVLLIPMLAITFGRMGIGHAINYYASRIPANALVMNTFALLAPLSLFIVMMTMGTVFLIKGHVFKGIDEDPIIAVCLAIPLSLIYENLASVLQGLYLINKRNIVVNLHPVLFFTAVASLAAVKSSFDIWSVTLMWIIALLISVMISLAVVVRETGRGLGRDVLDTGLMREILTFGIKSHMGNVLKNLSYRGDILLIGYLLNPAAVGYYVVAVNAAELIWKVPDSAGSVLLPRVARMNSVDARTFTPMVCRLILIPVILICLVVLFSGKSVIMFAFGEAYTPSIPVLQLLLPGIVVLSLWKIIASDLIGQGHPIKYSLTSGIGLVTMIALDLWLIPGFGIRGAAVASTISYTAATLSILFIYVRLTGNSVRDIVLPVREDFFIYKKLLKSIMPGASV